MTCEAVREHLGDHVLGSLPEATDTDIRAHLRGCMACRRELKALQEGVSTFARAAHQVEPPAELKDRVLATLEEERAASPARTGRRPAVARVAAAAVIVALAGALAWTGVVAVHATNRAARYNYILGSLGGKDFRVGTLQARGSQEVQGSVIMYDSEHGQSWILVLVHAPGQAGEARVTVLSQQSRIRLHPLRFDSAGEASTWLVTGSNISGFDRVRIADASGRTLAWGHVSHE
jgi:hypothetical protein